MDDCLDSGDTGDVAMVDVEGGELPAGGPKKDVVAASEHPQQRQVSETDNAGAIGEVTPNLETVFWVTVKRVSIGSVTAMSWLDARVLTINCLQKHQC